MMDFGATWTYLYRVQLEVYSLLSWSFVLNILVGPKIVVSCNMQGMWNDTQLRITNVQLRVEVRNKREQVRKQFESVQTWVMNGQRGQIGSMEKRLCFVSVENNIKVSFETFPFEIEDAYQGKVAGELDAAEVSECVLVTERGSHAYLRKLEDVHVARVDIHRQLALLDSFRIYLLDLKSVNLSRFM